ncbi:cytochrome P450 6k1-like [Ostrinia furnacalis]|uniref:cytochrome P450 6k1-like n=1 Tax=Ostrinia furnacalis TaxID=93504 RepID=UPI00103FFB1D|nr:cytochrome P450 6k1-like [Ostrinia furnacalis]
MEEWFQPHNLSYFLIITITIILSCYLYCSYKLNYWKRRGVIQLKNTSRIFGDFKDGILFRTPPGYHMSQLYKEAPADAPYVGFYIFHKPCLLLKDPEIIKQMLIRDFDNFSNRHFAGSVQKDSIGMINLFGIKNPAWRYLRRMITPTLSRGKLKQMLPLMIETGKPMMDHLDHLTDCKKPKVIDAQDVNYKYTADLISNVALGTKTNCFNFPDSDYCKNIMAFFHSFKRMVALVTVFFTPELVEMIGYSILFDSTFVRKMFWNAVESREKSREKRGDYIDSIINLKNGKQDSLYKFDGDNLLFQSGTFFSGFESSSTAAAFTLMELAKEKNIQDRVREDIKRAIDKHGWTLEAFAKMRYLDQCISEGIRLHPSVSTVDRCTFEDYQIPNTDVVIEKGTPVYISLYGLHGDPQYFEEPEKFKPERFDNDRIVPDAYIPFGAGPRKCVGVQVGQLHVKVVLSMILSEYEVYLPKSAEVKLDNRSTFTAAAEGINLQFIKLS